MDETNLLRDAPLLVVDDDPVNRDILSRRLIREGFAVTCVDSGVRALELACPDRFHLILLDVMMPEVSGLQVLEQLRRSYTASELPVIMVTARDQQLDVINSLKLGANDHVGKPFDFPVLLARIETQLRLRRLSKLKDEFLRIASHDLRNPLSFLALSTETMAAQLQPGAVMTPAWHGRLSRMAQRCGDMQRIISDLLDFGVLKDGGLLLSLAPTDLNSVVETAHANHEPMAQAKRLRVSTELDPGLAAVNLDRSRIEQVIDNLLGNAIKFCSPGDEVVLRTRACGSEILCEVMDSGRGLPEAELCQLFRKYSRLSARPTAGERSLGIGLFICKQIIELHGGQIGATNNPNATGITFWFRLPREACVQEGRSI